MKVGSGSAYIYGCTVSVDVSYITQRWNSGGGTVHCLGEWSASQGSEQFIVVPNGGRMSMNIGYWPRDRWRTLVT